MKKILSKLDFFQNEKFQKNYNGATSIEYAIIAAGIAMVIASIFYSLGTSVSGLYNTVSTAM